MNFAKLYMLSGMRRLKERGALFSMYFNFLKKLWDNSIFRTKDKIQKKWGDCLHLLYYLVVLKELAG